jgi:hypothetical protein
VGNVHGVAVTTFWFASVGDGGTVLMASSSVATGVQVTGAVGGGSVGVPVWATVGATTRAVGVGLVPFPASNVAASKPNNTTLSPTATTTITLNHNGTEFGIFLFLFLGVSAPCISNLPVSDDLSRRKVEQR